ncbi:MAG: trypsin-like serine protease [Halobacteriovoraceae bacterium]|nr:trypsin-like serine protease [Halobacteriovoraceae bacterium]
MSFEPMRDDKMKKHLLIIGVCSVFFFGVFFHIAFNSPETSNVNRFVASSTEIPDEIIENALSMTVTISTPVVKTTRQYDIAWEGRRLSINSGKEETKQYDIRCHGILISPDEVLTAGHCINSKLVRKSTLDSMVVTIHHKVTEEQLEVTHYAVKGASLHPRYSLFKVPLVESSHSAANDAGIIKLGEEIPFEYILSKQKIHVATRKAQGMPAEFVDMRDSVENISYEKCSLFMVDWRTALVDAREERKVGVGFNDVFINKVRYDFPLKDPDSFFLISLLGQAKSFLLHGASGLFTLGHRGQNLIRKEKTVKLFTQKKIYPGYSGGPLWCYTEDEGLVYMGFATAGHSHGNVIIIKSIDPAFARWIQDNNHGID